LDSANSVSQIDLMGAIEELAQMLVGAEHPDIDEIRASKVLVENWIDVGIGDGAKDK
jgi:hypothetical protein